MPRSPTFKKPPIRRLVDGSRSFWNELSEGVDSKEVQRLFDREAGDALRTLAGRRDGDARPDDAFERFVEDVHAVARGFLRKLSPARRVLFLFSIASAVVGALNLDAYVSPSTVSFEIDPLWFFLSIGGLCLLLALELVDRLRVRDELEVARQLQRDLLPQSAPRLPGWRIAHSYRTANEIGGDYYDFLPLDDGRLVLAVGDASGHGISAGLLMAVGNAGLETAVDLDPDPGAVLRLLGRTLHRTGGRRAFMTLFYAVLDPRSGHLDWAVAGHPFPLLRRAGGTVEELGEGALPLGVRLEAQFARGTAELAEGDLLLLFTDGIPEAENENGEAFGFPHIRDLVAASRDADDAHDRVLRAFDGHVGDASLRDDLTLVAISRHPAPPTAPPQPPRREERIRGAPSPGSPAPSAPPSPGSRGRRGAGP